MNNQNEYTSLALFNSWLESSSNHDNESKTTVLDTRGVDTIGIITLYPTKPNTSKQRHQKKGPCRETRKIIPAFYASTISFDTF